MLFKIYPIYPKEETILGEKVYRSLLDFPEKVAMADMFRKPEIADSLVDEALQRGDVKVVWLQLGIINNAANIELTISYLKVFFEHIDCIQ